MIQIKFVWQRTNLTSKMTWVNMINKMTATANNIKIGIRDKDVSCEKEPALYRHVLETVDCSVGGVMLFKVERMIFH